MNICFHIWFQTILLTLTVTSKYNWQTMFILTAQKKFSVRHENSRAQKVILAQVRGTRGT